jgi:2-succinyl-5-enolpyruvyl-6-hydroxy-3-cyclohexene-1-carboxylate synthase
VHLNLPFREPLLGTPGELPPARPSVWRAAAATVAATVDLSDLPGRRVVVVAGSGARVAGEQLDRLVAARGWPVLADPLSGVRQGPNRVAAFDPVLRSTRLAVELRPDLVVRIGRPPASRVLSTWIAASGAPVLQVGGPGVVDPGHDVVAHVTLDDLTTLPEDVDSGWVAAWSRAAEVAERTIDEVLAEQPSLTEPLVARTVARALPADVRLVVASSMPVRDLEWFGGPTARAHANRGANGIDGVVSTAIGVALLGRPVVVLVGDVAMLHDANALVALRWLGAEVRIVVVDNDGGGIFSFLPQANGLAPATFERLFGTPHGTDLVALASAIGLDAATADGPDALVSAVTTPGSRLVRVATERDANRALHAELEQRIVAALELDT